jgi:hypothetical protein
MLPAQGFSSSTRGAFILGFSVFLLLAGNAAAAQIPSNCGRHTDVVAALGDRYGEKQSATAMTSGGGLLEVLTAKDGVTWTIIISRPDGFSCVVAAGESWQDKEAPGTTEISY